MSMMPIVAPTGSLKPNVSQSFGGIHAGGSMPPWMQPQAFQNGMGGAMPSQFQPPGALSGDNFPGGMQGGGQQFVPYQNFIPQAQPANYNPGGGFMPAPIGGYWNQMAQQMAGPVYGPQGASVTMGQTNPIAAMNPSPVTQQGASAMLAHPPQLAGAAAPGNLGALGSLGSLLSGSPLASSMPLAAIAANTLGHNYIGQGYRGPFSSRIMAR